MNRAPVIAVCGAVVLALVILFWPVARDRDDTVEGRRPGPIAIAASGPESGSEAAGRIRFVPPGQTLTVEGEGEAAAPPPVDALPILVGVVGAEDRPVGYFSSNGQVFRAGKGGAVDGWRVTALGRGKAQLARSGRRLNLTLYAPRSGALSPPMAALPPPPPAAAAPPPASQTAQPPPSTTSPGSANSKGPRVRRPLPPLPPGSKGYWIGPPGSMPPGFTPMPKTD